jgi:hypothetical protein
MLVMILEQLVEWMEGETKVLGENLPPCRSVLHRPHMTWCGLEPGLRGGKPATDRLS